MPDKTPDYTEEKVPFNDVLRQILSAKPKPKIAKVKPNATGEKMNENKDDLYSRVTALEFLVSGLLMDRYMQHPDPIAAAKQHRELIRDTTSRVALSDQKDAAMSELIVGSVGDCIDKLVEEALQSVQRKIQQQTHPIQR